MKKSKILISLVLACMMLLSACGGSAPAATTEAAAPAAASYTGTAQGMGGEVSVTLTIENGVITDCVATGDKETDGIGSVVIAQFPAQVVEGNTINLDAVSGATITSNAFIEAAKAALTAAGLNPDDYMTKVAAAAAGDVTKEADVVIVGAGPVGLSLAIDLAQRGVPVGLLRVVADHEPLVLGDPHLFDLQVVPNMLVAALS